MLDEHQSRGVRRRASQAHLKEVSGSFLPVPLVHVHLAAALPDDAHDAWVGDGALDGEGLHVQLLQLLGVLLGTVQLNLQRVHFQQLRALLQVVCAILRLAGPAGGRLVSIFFLELSVRSCRIIAFRRQAAVHALGMEYKHDRNVHPAARADQLLESEVTSDDLGRAS